MIHVAGQDRATHGALGHDGIGKCAGGLRGPPAVDAVVGHEVEEAVAIDMDHNAEGRVAEANGTPHDGVKTGWTSVGELEMTRRISRGRRLLLQRLGQGARLTSASDGAGGPLGLAVRGVPHASQNFACGRFSCWHRGHRIPSGSRVRIVSGQPGTASRHPGRHRSSASRPFRGARAPRPYPDPASGARWAVLGRGSPWSLWGDPVGGSDESELTSTPRS